jgi:hypothetical protein
MIRHSAHKKRKKKKKKEKNGGGCAHVHAHLHSRSIVIQQLIPRTVRVRMRVDGSTHVDRENEASVDKSGCYKNTAVILCCAAVRPVPSTPRKRGWVVVKRVDVK